ncbi:MAG: ANTAR domain-containing response regulator [Candidatus Zipacnadales bacterium]
MSRSAASTPTALICEDELITAARLAEDLEALGFTVVAQCSDGYAAVEAAMALQPQLILMDIRLPGMDGLEAVRQIRAHLGVCPTVLVITAYADNEFVRRAAEVGCEGYLIKPVSLDQLRISIHIAQETTRRLQEAVDEAATMRKRLEDRKLIERAKGILMEMQGLTEGAAYRYLQKESQNQRRPMAELAQELIQTQYPCSRDEEPTPPSSV